MRKPWTWTTLQSNITRLRHQTLEGVNRIFLQSAQAAGIETGQKIRTDCTAVESNIHTPTDSSLLWDGVRVLTRCLHSLRKTVPSADIHFSDHTRRARRRQHAIAFPAKGRKRRRHLRDNYHDLLKVARKTGGYARAAVEHLTSADLTAIDPAERVAAQALVNELRGYLPLMDRVIDQTTRRVIRGEQVPADEKVLSLFETHTDVIVEGSRAVVFGHKVCLTGGASSLILDCLVEAGNPADSTLVRPALERQSTSTASHLARRVSMVALRPGRTCASPKRSSTSKMSRFTRNAGSRSTRWSAAHGSTGGCVTSAPASKVSPPPSRAAA